MKSYRAHRRPGRPLLGAEPLNERLTVMVSGSLLRGLQERSGGRVSEYVRAALERAVSGAGSRLRRRRGRSVRRVRRYTK